MSTSVLSASASASPMTPGSVTPGIRCIDQTLSIPQALNHSSQLETSVGFIAFYSRDYTCQAPGCVIAQTYNSSNLAQNVSDISDVQRRCNSAGGDFERITTFGNDTGYRGFLNYCMLENAERVPALIGNLTGAEKATVYCSTQAYRYSEGVKVKGVGRAFLAVMVISGAALAVVGI